MDVMPLELVDNSKVRDSRIYRSRMGSCVCLFKAVEKSNSPVAP